ncbi:phosphatase PAP2 family protein [Paenibacillus barcinonensis]|uniref:Phosphatase PAP2 family protein n=1 Tax=Paenibacillus barcinonensis TaxID=198119 RepID=A0A2V4V0B3_PAEBA|nr:phosphatase PAP2 family protein [Paenibacillus barcinonensis]PYE45793.1 undecaprenyl-diphosphatase [Paenibacillus barcinonensis]QKS57073.1 phosphatase PAP2 family protein [Paenibacillus barcinonensis]
MLRNSKPLSSDPKQGIPVPMQPLLKYTLLATLLSAAMVLLLAGIGAWMGPNRILKLDDWIQRLFYLDSEARLLLLPYTSWITAIGSFKISALAAAGFALLCFVQRRARTTIYGYVICISFAMMWILNTLLKEIFQRNRPEIEHLLAVHGYSYPSGHAMISMGFYGMLFVIWALEWRQHHTFKRWLPVMLGVLFILFIGLSRIMLGVHYPTDVLAGFASGLIWVVCLLQGIKQASR